MVGIWSRCRKGAATAVLVSIALLGQGVLSAPAGAATPRSEMASLTNADRTARGRSALALDPQLSRYAKRHSREMAARNDLFHTRDLAAKLDGRDWSIGGENVGVASSLPELERAFMRSDPHRRNILRNGFEHMAVGVHVDGGRVWVTVIFYG
jgi:uncharacterized protein YkwD